jgi:fructuronate reductase
MAKPETLHHEGMANAAAAKSGYDRSRLQTGIVHLGLGAFHRAHQALYTEAAVQAGDLRWGIVGVSLRDPRLVNTLTAQNGLYSVTERHGDAARSRTVGVIRKALFAPGALDEVLATIADPATSIVTTTVTEKGYTQNPATASLDLDDPGIRHDLAHPDQPQTTIGVLAAAIARRPADAPLTLVCCDNMAGNGDTLGRLLVQYAEQFNPTLARRMASDIGTPNSMVDRIVPAATAQSLDWAEQQIGVRDDAAIVCEPFTQWVIEDRFTGPRPAWEAAGAILTRDVRPFQTLKLRLLNGSHSAIAYWGQLCGLGTVADAMRHPLLAAFVRRLMVDELLSTVAVPAGYDAQAYCKELLHRFDNPSLAHRTAQIAMDGSQKVPVRWLPALRDAIARERELPALERSLAAWFHYLQARCDQQGHPLVISDPGANVLTQRMACAGDPRSTVAAAFSVESVFGDIPWSEAVLTRVAGHLGTIRVSGVEALLAI